MNGEGERISILAEVPERCADPPSPFMERGGEATAACIWGGEVPLRRLLGRRGVFSPPSPPSPLSALLPLEAGGRAILGGGAVGIDEVAAPEEDLLGVAGAAGAG